MDSDLLLKSMNPELYNLLVRVKSIYAICGGDTGVKVDKKQMKQFDYKKAMLINRIVQLENLSRDKKKIEGSMGGASRDIIRMKNTMRTELEGIEADLAELTKQSIKEGKDKSVSNAEIVARSAVLTSIEQEYHKVYEASTGFKHRNDDAYKQGGVGMPVLSKEALMKGTFAGAGMKMEREALSGENMQQMELIRREVEQQDAILEEMSKGLDELRDIAEKIQDELQYQEKMLADLENKTDKTQAKMDAVNERSKEALAKLNDKSTNICIYLICFAILGALAVIVYRFVATK